MISSAFCLSIARLVCSFSRGIESLDAPFLNLDSPSRRLICINLPIAQIYHAIKTPPASCDRAYWSQWSHPLSPCILSNTFDDFPARFSNPSFRLAHRPKIKSGSLDNGPGDSHALLLTARQFVGLVMQAVAEAHPATICARHFSSYSLRDMPENTMGKATFSSAVNDGNQVERLKNIPHTVAAQIRNLPLAQCRPCSRR